MQADYASINFWYRILLHQICRRVDGNEHFSSDYQNYKKKTGAVNGTVDFG